MTWRYKYYFAGKREKLTIGRHPEIGLAKAGELHDDAVADCHRKEPSERKVDQ